MPPSPDITSQLSRELDETRLRLAEAEETLAAIRTGEVDSLVVAGPAGDQIFTLTGAQEPYRLLIEQMSEGALTLSREGMILYANQTFARLLQTPLEQVIGAELQAFVSAAEQPAITGLIEAAWSGGSSRGQASVRTADGPSIPLQLGLSRLELGTEILVCVVATDLTEARQKADELAKLHAGLERRVAERTADLAASRLAALNMMEEAVEAHKAIETVNGTLTREITKRKALEDGMKEAVIAAEAGSRAKSEFLAIMSHELRTPLNGVLGFAELLSDTSLDDEQKGYVRTIGKSGKHLLAVINDILDLASIEAGTLAIQSALLALTELLEVSVVAAQKTAADKGINFRCEVAADVPAQITGDEHRLRQILINLLGNAVKFTDSGSVVLRVAPDAEGRFLDFAVEDTGIGISSETIGRLFEVFTQADASTNRRFGGAGLGLAISKRLAEAMGGTITVVSVPGKGSTFTFHFPLEVPPGGMAAVPSHLLIGADGASPSSPSAETPRPDASHLLALVVDDDNASGVVAVKMLQKLGYHAEFVVDGAKAIEAFVPGKYSFILMDVAMPVMDGLEATKKIREAEAAAGGHVTIIAFTAQAMHGDRERCLAAGMDDCLSKPFKKEELAAKLSSWQSRTHAPPMTKNEVPSTSQDNIPCPTRNIQT